MSRKKQRSLWLPRELDDRFVDYCRRTNRAEAETLRAIIRIFFERGFEACERTLTSGLWDATDSAPPQPQSTLTKQEAEDRAEYLHTGKVAKRRKEGAA